MLNKIKSLICFFSLVFISYFLFGCDDSNDSLSESNAEVFYTVTYKNISNNVYGTEEIKSGNALEIDFIPETEGYKFMGWYLDENLINILPENYVVNNDVVVYAKMNKIISMNLIYGENQVKVDKAIEETFVLPEYKLNDEFELVGYTCNDIFYKLGESIKVSEDKINFTANFAKVLYASFDLNGGVGSEIDTIKSLENNEIILPSISNDLVYDYEFIGWSDGVNTYLPSSKYTLKENVTFKAVYDIEKTLNLIVDSVVYKTIELDSYSNYTYTLPELEDIKDENDVLKLLFVGWSDGTNTYSANESYVVDEEVKYLNALFKLNTFLVTFRDWDGTVIKSEDVEYGSNATAPSSELFEVEEFTGWSKNFDDVKGVINTRAQYTFTQSYNAATAQNYFEYLEQEGKLYIGSKKDSVVPEILYLPTSYGGRLIDGVNTFRAQEIKEVYIPATYSELLERSFRDCKSLVNVHFSTSSNLNIIKGEAFETCTSLKTITIPEGVTILNQNVFHSCHALESVYLPSTLQEVGSHLFYNDTLLTSINVPDTSEYFKTIDGHLYTKDEKEIVYYAIGQTNTSYTVLDSVVKIGRCAFQKANYLNKIVLGNNIEEFGNYAFANCENLTSSITIPTTVKTVGVGVFNSCSAPVVLTEGITSIPEKMFQYYKGESIYIPSTINSIGEYAFASSSIKELIIAENYNLKEIKSNAFYYCNKLETFAFENLKALEVIDEYAFYYSGLTGEYTFPASLTTISNSAFEKSNIKSVTIERNSSLSLIGESAFFNCANLEKFVYEDGKVTSTIGTYCFADNFSLKELVLPNKLSIISPYAFGVYYNDTNCNLIENLDIPAAVEYIGDYAFAGSKMLKNITFKGNNLKTISNYAFKECNSLTSLKLPSSLTNIGVGIIHYCNSLSSLTIEENDNFETVDNVLYDKNNLKLLTGVIGESKTLNIKKGTLSVGDYAFTYNPDLITLNINDELKEINSHAFAQCLNLENVNFAENGSLELIGDYAFADSVVNASYRIAAMKIKNLKLPSSIKYIKLGAFIGNGLLESITLPASLIDMESFVFSDCYELKTVYTEENSNLEAIGKFNFVRCNKLEYVEVKSTKLSMINNGAFSGCESLDTLIINSNNCVMNANALKSTPSTLKIYVPGESVDSYKIRSEWSNFANQIYSLEELN